MRSFLFEVSLQQWPDFRNVDIGVGFGDELAERDKLVESEGAVYMDDGANR